MTLEEMKKKVLAMIEELNAESELLTDDPDIFSKINDVTNQVMYEVSRMKKLPRYVEIEAEAGDLIQFTDIERACGYEVYQLGNVGGVQVAYKADGTVIKVLESGVVEINCYIYPERITENTGDSYEFELPADVLEVMPYGIAGDLLKSDVSADYGAIYANRYEQMLQRLDPRYQMISLSIDGGLEV